MAIIEALHLENFRLHEDTNFNPSPQVNLITALSGHGKTSLLSAMEFAVKGTCLWTTDSGQGSNDLVRGGSNKSAVRMKIKHGDESFKIERTIPSSPGVRDLQATITDKLKVSPAVLEVCLRPLRFLDLPSDKQKSLLWEILGEISPGELRKRLNSWRPDVEGLGSYYFDHLIPDSLSTVKDHYKHINEVLLRQVKANVSSARTRIEESEEASPHYDAAAHELAEKQYSELQLKITSFSKVQYKNQYDKLKEESLKIETELDENPVVPLKEELRKVDEILGTIKPEDNCPGGTCLRSKAAACEILKANIQYLHNIEQSLCEKVKTMEQLSLLIGDHKLVPDAKDDLTLLQQQSKEINDKIRMFDVDKVMLDEYKKKQKQLDDLKKKLSQLEDVEKKLSSLKDALGPSGIKARVMEEKIDSFMQTVNMFLGVFAPPLVLDQIGWVFYGNARGKQVPASAMSDSQIVRHNLGIQVAVAKITGFNIVSLDRAESIDTDTLENCLRFLVDQGVQSFVAKVVDEPVELKIEGVTSWWVHKGTISLASSVAKEVAA